VDGLVEGQQRPLSAPLHTSIGAGGDQESNTNDDRVSLHPDDPKNFMKLCSALRILIRRRLTDPDINRAEGLLREYGTELISVF
jgi:hypothetical protein